MSVSLGCPTGFAISVRRRRSGNLAARDRPKYSDVASRVHVRTAADSRLFVHPLQTHYLGAHKVSTAARCATNRNGRVGVKSPSRRAVFGDSLSIRSQSPRPVCTAPSRRAATSDARLRASHGCEKSSNEGAKSQKRRIFCQAMLAERRDLKSNILRLGCGGCTAVRLNVRLSLAS